MTRLILRLLGGFEVSREDPAEVGQLGKKSQALLAYVALSPEQRFSRDALATLLWGDRFDEQARHSLRQSVLTVRRALDDEEASVLVSDGDGLALNREAVEVDVHRFERLAAGDTREDVEQAVDLYRGDLLDGLSVRSEGFDEWLAGERSRLRDLAADTLGRLAELYSEAEMPAEAIEAAQRLLALDPLREDGHRLLMRLFDATGRRSAALKQYRICEEALRRGLDAEPEAETLRVYDEIQRGNEDVRDAPAEPAAAPDKRKPAWRKPWFWAAAAALALLMFAGGLFWTFYLPITDPPPDDPEIIEVIFPLPDKPSIAILPFQSIGGDPEQEAFVDGITEDITTALSMLSDMFVIARNSALTYKDKPVEVRQVAKELGVRYVLEGSVQRSGGRLRITAKLIDALEGHYVWADRYDREAQDIFALQDDITKRVMNALRVEITEGEQARIDLIHGTSNLDAWILGTQAHQRARRLTKQDNAKARDLFQRAAVLDPTYPGAWDGLAWTHLIDARLGWGESREASLRRAAELAQKALALDPSRPRTYGLLGSIQLLSGNHEQAIAFGQRAVALHPSGAEMAALLALTLTYTGEPERSEALLQRAMRLSPYYPDWYRWTLGRAYRLLGRHEQAVDALETRLEDSPDSLVPYVELAATYSEMGRQAEARAAAAEVLRVNPAFSVRAWTQVPPHKNREVSMREFEALRDAGLPE